MTATVGGPVATFGWLACNEDDVPAGTDWLSTWEAARLERMRFTKRRREYLTSRFTAKHAMALLLGMDPDPLRAFEVRHHPTGAPAPHVHDAAAPLSVSMTDRADWAVTVAHPDAGHRLGCDLELVEARSEAFVRDWFTPPERDRVLAASGEERDLLANLVWSAKESGLKVLQTGLRRDTRSVEVVLHDDTDRGWRRLEVVAVEGPRMPGWWRRFGHFVLTVAADVDLPPPTPLHPDAHGIGDAVPRHTWVDDPLT